MFLRKIYHAYYKPTDYLRLYGVLNDVVMLSFGDTYLRGSIMVYCKLVLFDLFSQCFSLSKVLQIVERAQQKMTPGTVFSLILKCHYSLTNIKDIVQPKKRGVLRGTIRFVLNSYTIADFF